MLCYVPTGVSVKHVLLWVADLKDRNSMHAHGLPFVASSNSFLYKTFY